MSRGILIDPFARTISEVQYDGDYRSIYKLIDCDIFTAVCLGHLSDGETLWVDDEGLLVPAEEQAFFSIAGVPNPLAGKGLILSSDEDGESIGSELSLHEVAQWVQWYTATPWGLQRVIA